MDEERYRGRVDVGAGLATMALGAFFAALAATISPDAYDTVGPRFVPALLAGAMLGLGALVALGGWRRARRPSGVAPAPGAAPDAPSVDPAATDPAATDPAATDPDATDPDATDPDAADPVPSVDDDFGFRGSDLRRVAQVIGCGTVYVALFWAVGYLVATAVAMLLMLLAFGNRSPLVLALVPIAAALVYQYVFVGLMGLYDPAGALVDLSALGARVSGP